MRKQAGRIENTQKKNPNVLVLTQTLIHPSIAQLGVKVSIKPMKWFLGLFLSSISEEEVNPNWSIKVHFSLLSARLKGLKYLEKLQMLHMELNTYTGSVLELPAVQEASAV